jgi:hypothetical protein
VFGCKEGAKSHVAQKTCSLRLTYYNDRTLHIITGIWELGFRIADLKEEEGDSIQ